MDDPGIRHPVGKANGLRRHGMRLDETDVVQRPRLSLRNPLNPLNPWQAFEYQNT